MLRKDRADAGDPLRGPSGNARQISVLLVDDEEVIRVGLHSLLEREHSIRVVGETGTAADAVALAIQLRPDVVLMEVKLPDWSGIEACREIRASVPCPEVIMLTSDADDETVLASIAAGAAGYLLKQILGRDLVRAIETVSAGHSLLDPAVTRKVLDRVKLLGAPDLADEFAALSAQELRVLALVADGKTNREIATALGLSGRTVKNYLAHVFDKLNVSRRAEAAVRFVRHHSGAPEPVGLAR